MPKKSLESKIHGLDRFGLTLSKLSKFRNKKVKLRAYVTSCPPGPLYKLSPDERRHRMELWRRKAYQVLASSPLLSKYERIGTARRPEGLKTDVLAGHILQLLKIKSLSFISVDRVQGIKPVVQKVLETFFGVFARFFLQEEGQKNGLQEYEDRLLIVMATSYKDAERRLKKDFRDYAEPYLNIYGRLVRWKYEKVLGVYDINRKEIDPKGTEVYSVFKNRRMKPEYEWHPLKEKKRKIRR